MGRERFFADVSSKKIARHGAEMVSPLAGVNISIFTIYHVLPDLPGDLGASTRNTSTVHCTWYQVPNAGTFYDDTCYSRLSIPDTGRWTLEFDNNSTVWATRDSDP